jgi:hypothetical protein
MFKPIFLFIPLILVGIFLLGCKPVRKSYLPYKKRNKCGCPTYGVTFIKPSFISDMRKSDELHQLQ